MSFSIGRFGLDTTQQEPVSFTIDRPNTPATGGGVAGEETVTLSFWILAATQAAADAARQQIQQVADNPWETQIPFCWGTDSAMEGFLTNCSCSVSSPIGYAYRGQFAYKVDFRGQRVAAYSLPRIEATMNGVVRTNAQGPVTTAATTWHAWSINGTGYDFAGRGDGISTRVGPGGSVNLIQLAGQSYFSGYPQWTQTPSDYYTMAATILEGSALRAVVGRQIDAAHNLTTWEVSNGLVRIRPGSGTSLLEVTQPLYSAPASWGTPMLIEVGRKPGGTWFPYGPVGIKNIAVKRNGPELVVLRLTVEFAPNGLSNRSYFTVDISLRRGARGALVTIQSPWADKWGIGFHTATVMADQLIGGFGAGNRQAADDADHNRMMFLCALLNTRDNVNGRLQATNAVNVGDYAIFTEFGGSSAAAADINTKVTTEYYAAQNETQRVVIP